MSERSQQRGARRAALQLRFAHQREQLADSFSAVQRHLEPIEKTLTTLRTIRRAPLLVGIIGSLAALGATLFSRRSRRPSAAPLAWWLPLAGTVLKILELWWQHRTGSPARPVTEPPDPPRP
jgi:hypothetical protein